MGFNRSGKTGKTLETESDIKNAALGLLARREHSVKELMTKLVARCADEDMLDNVIFSLQESGYVSDQRFVESFCARGYIRVLVLKIQFDMRDKGISSDMLDLAMQEQEIDWFAQALDVYRRKFRSEESFDAKGYAKRMRYMMQRDLMQNRLAMLLMQKKNKSC
ncbi:regulatory protein RecX [Aliamphritea spongicola]|nr:regulatory protein RecX [Aliamphritea spongicola]